MYLNIAVVPIRQLQAPADVGLRDLGRGLGFGGSHQGLQIPED